MRTSSSTYVIKEIAIYSINKDNKNFTIIYDLEYKSSYLYRYINLSYNVSNIFNKGLRNKDIYNLASLTISFLYLP